jgi:LDH2 family malate/lactate/ureidoglycolate dehydrogenase
MSAPTTTIPLTTLKQFCNDAIARMGIRPDDGAILADVLLSGSLRSQPGQGQGIQQLPTYYQRIQRSVVKVDAAFEVVNRQGAVALLDGHHGLGAVMGTRAMQLALDIAAENGIGAVGVRHSTHFGIAAYYAMLTLPRDSIGLAFSNAGPEIAPWGGMRAIVGTNPWAVAVPAGAEWPVVLDMANSTSGKGMIDWRLKENLPIPNDWALTTDGGRTEDAAAGMAGTLFPLGGPKGYALAVIVDALTGVLTGSAFGLSCFGESKQDVGHLMIALKVSSFMSVDEFKARMDAFIEEIRSSPRAPGVKEIYLPGEPEYRRERERRVHGVPIENSRLEALRALGAELDVATELVG